MQGGSGRGAARAGAGLDGVCHAGLCVLPLWLFCEGGVVGWNQSLLLPIGNF